MSRYIQGTPDVPYDETGRCLLANTCVLANFDLILSYILKGNMVCVIAVNVSKEKYAHIFQCVYVYACEKTINKK